MKNSCDVFGTWSSRWKAAWIVSASPFWTHEIIDIIRLRKVNWHFFSYRCTTPMLEEILNVMAGQPSPTLPKKGLIRPYEGKPMVNKPLLRPYFWDMIKNDKLSIFLAWKETSVLSAMAKGWTRFERVGKASNSNASAIKLSRKEKKKRILISRWWSKPADLVSKQWQLYQLWMGTHLTNPNLDSHKIPHEI